MHYHTLKTVLLAGWKGNANVKGKEDKKKTTFNISFVALMYLH